MHASIFVLTRLIWCIFDLDGGRCQAPMCHQVAEQWRLPDFTQVRPKSMAAVGPIASLAEVDNCLAKWL